MSVRTVLTILILFGVAKSSYIDDFKDICGRTDTTVIGRLACAKTAEASEAPWQVSVFYDGLRDHWCGGILVTDRHVLSAAHCFRFPLCDSLDCRLGNFTFHFGRTNRTNIKHDDGSNFYLPDRNGITRKAAALIFYKRWKYDFIYRDGKDIVVILLKEPVPFSKYVKPICLAEGSTRRLFDANSEVSSTGFGFNDSASSKELQTPTRLQKAMLTILSREKCGVFHPNGLAPDFICADSVKRCSSGLFAASCHGDSGSPLVAQDGNRVWHLGGIVSFGSTKCGDTLASIPSYYISVEKHYEWIVNQIERTTRVFDKRRKSEITTTTSTTTTTTTITTTTTTFTTTARLFSRFKSTASSIINAPPRKNASSQNLGRIRKRKNIRNIDVHPIIFPVERKSVLVVAGGSVGYFDSQAVNASQVIDFEKGDSNCYFPELPQNGVYLFAANIDTFVVICGFTNGDSDRRVACYTYKDYSFFKYDNVFLSDATSSAVSEIERGVLWVTGGGGTNPVKTSEILKAAEFPLRAFRGHDLPVKLSWHCAVTLGSKTYLIGGISVNSFYSRMTWIFHRDSETWEAGPLLEVGRQKHFCAVFNGNKIVIGGGYRKGGRLYDTEILDTRSGGWTPGPYLPFSLNNMAVAQGRDTFYIAGGWNDEALTKILKFNEDGFFEERELDVGRHKPAAFFMDRKVLCKE